MESKVEIIVPIYNKELTIKKCLASIEEQSYKNISILMIDDGSTDNSKKICEYYEKKDDRFLLITKKNGGVSSARNKGLENVKGDYLLFVDADDFLECRYVETLLKYASSPFVVSGYKIFNEKLSLIDKAIPNAYMSKNWESIVKYIFDSKNLKFFTSPWGKLFKTEYIKKNRIKFRNISYGEDMCFVFDYMKAVRQIHVISECEYGYVLEPNSLSRSKIDNIWNKLNDINEYCRNEYYKKYDTVWNYMYIRIIKISLANSNRTYKEFYAQAKNIIEDKEFYHVCCKKLNSINDKIIYFLIKTHFYKILYISFKIKG